MQKGGIGFYGYTLGLLHMEEAESSETMGNMGFHGKMEHWKAEIKKVYFRILLPSFRIVYTLGRKNKEQPLLEIRQK